VDKWNISYPKWTYKPVHHGLYTYQRAPTSKKPILVVIQKKVDCIFLSELVSHSIELLDIYHKVPTIAVMCLEGIDDRAKILLTKTKKGAYMASGSFWKNVMFVLTPELIPHGNSSMEKLVTQQFYKLNNPTIE
jgi:hypothetical protein